MQRKTHLMAIKMDTPDGLLAGRDPATVFPTDGLLDELKKGLAERRKALRVNDHW